MSQVLSFERPEVGTDYVPQPPAFQKNSDFSPSSEHSSDDTPKEHCPDTLCELKVDPGFEPGGAAPLFRSEVHHATVKLPDFEGQEKLDSQYSNVDHWVGSDSFSVESNDVFEAEASKNGGELSVSPIDEKYNDRLRKARMISYIGFVVSLIQGSVAIGLGISHNMISLTAMGAQICIDLLSSVMVIWRFYSRSETPRRHPRHADTNYRLREALREKRAAMGVGVLLILTSVWAASWGFVKVFKAPPSPELRIARAFVALSVAWPGCVLFSIIALIKWSFALKLCSRVLQKDAVCTTFGAGVSFITSVFASIDYAVSQAGPPPGNTGAADSVAALIMAAVIMIEGVRTIYQNTIGWIPPSGVTKETVEHYYLNRHSPKFDIPSV